jgi:zinc transporter ZupT
MLFIISDEISPATHAKSRSRLASIGIIAGFGSMMSLENLRR